MLTEKETSRLRNACHHNGGMSNMSPGYRMPPSALAMPASLKAASDAGVVVSKTSMEQVLSISEVAAGERWLLSTASGSLPTEVIKE